MILRATIERPSVTLDLPHMSVTVRDDGTVTVRQAGRKVAGGMYDMGGEYELTLPDASVIAAECSTRDADPASDDFPASGTASIPVTHLH